MARTFKIVIHIGTEKTGTKTLQKALFNNRKTFLNEGFYYLHGEAILDSRDIAAACVGDKKNDDFLASKAITTPEQRQVYREKIKRELAEKIEQLPEGVHTLLLSSEHFHSRLREPFMVENLRALLEPYAHTFEVLCYLRRQVDMVVSYYSTILKGKRTDTFERAVKAMLRADHHYCNYDLFLSKWEKVFSAECLRIKLFERAALVGGSIVDDVTAEVGIPAHCMLNKTDNINESITHLGQVLLREVNVYSKSVDTEEPKKQKTFRERLAGVILGKHRQFPADEAKRLKALKIEAPEQRTDVRDMVVEGFAGKGRSFPPQEAKRLQALFDTSNESVRARWFPERAVLFDNDFPEVDPCYITEEQERIISAIMMYIASCGEKRLLAQAKKDDG